MLHLTTARLYNCIFCTRKVLQLYNIVNSRLTNQWSWLTHYLWNLAITDTLILLGLSLQNSNIFRNYNACYLQGRQPQTYSCRSCSFIYDLSHIPRHNSTPKMSEKIQNPLYSSCAPDSWKERFRGPVIPPDIRVSKNHDKLSVTQSHVILSLLSGTGVHFKQF